VRGAAGDSRPTATVGAIAAAKNKLINPAWPVLGIEASKAQPNAKLGQGAVVRVGDATTVFNPELTSNLRKISRELKLNKDGGLNYVESLMPGGSTESTGLALLGYETCAVCLPLGNYHNMGKRGIAPEQISLNDYESLVALLAETVQHAPNAALQKAIKKRLLENYKKRAPLL
jgi:putative aminopeptidase FrvX